MEGVTVSSSQRCEKLTGILTILSHRSRGYIVTDTDYFRLCVTFYDIEQYLKWE